MIKLTNAEDAIFHTIQGEGKYIGYPCTFVRLTNCNLRCQWLNKDGSTTRCDTPHTSFEPVVEKHEVQDILDKVGTYRTDHVVVSGGEPFFQKEVASLISGLVENGHYVTVETNGTLYHSNRAQYLSISPKLSSSCASPTHGKRQEKNRLNITTLSTMVRNHKYQFKFVVNDEKDIAEIEDISKRIYECCGEDIDPNIWLMPQGITPDQFNEKMQWLAEVCKNKSWKLTDRLHIRIWGAKKGV